MRKQALIQAQTQLSTLKTIKSHYEAKLNIITPSLNNNYYLRILNKLSKLDYDILLTESLIKRHKRQNRLHKRLFVALNSRVKLVAVDVEITLWVDAKNVTMILGKSIGEIVNLYNAQFKIAAIY